MSPVSPHKREVSPSRRSLSPPAELAAYSKNQTEPLQTSEWTSTKQRFLKPLTLDRLAYEHECSSSVKGWNMHIVHICAPLNIYIKKHIIKDFSYSVEVTAGYIEVLFQKHKIRGPKWELLYWAIFLLHIDYNLYNQLYYKYHG